MNEPITDQGIDQEEAVSSSEISAEASGTPDQSTVIIRTPKVQMPLPPSWSNLGNKPITEIAR